MVIYILFSLISFGFLLVKEKHLQFYAFVSALVIGYISYFIIVPETSDMYRHFQEIDYFRKIGWAWHNSENRINTNLGTLIVFYIFSLLPNNAIFLFSIPFLSYFLIFKLIIMIFNDYNYSKNWLFTASLFATFSFSYFYLIFSVRTWIMFIVFFYTLYIEMIREKHIFTCWICYFFLILFHYSAIILVCLRFFFLIIDFKANTWIEKIKKYFLLLIILFLVILSFKLRVFSIIIMKYNNYKTYNVYGMWQIFSCIGKTMGCVLMVICLWQKKWDKIRQNYSKFILGVFIIICFFANNYQILLRFSDCLIIASIPILPDQMFFQQRKASFYHAMFCMTLVIISSVIYNVIFDYRLISFTY